MKNSVSLILALLLTLAVAAGCQDNPTTEKTSTDQIVTTPAASPTPDESQYPLSAGAAKGDITPDAGLLPMPFFLQYTMDRVVDPIYVRVLALDDGQNRALFVTFDMMLIPRPEETLQLIHDVTGVDEQNIFMAATHTHEVPNVGDQEKDQAWYTVIKNTLKDTLERAVAAKKPARIGYGTGKSYINVNRDEIINGNGIAGVNFERPSDKTVALVRIEDEQGAPIALIVNYAVHATIMNGTSVNDGIGITGDLPGRTSAMLEENLGGVAMWTSGAAGDQNPRISTQYGDPKFENGKLIVDNLGETGYLILDYLAKEHVQDIMDVNASIICDQAFGKISAAERKIECPGQEGKSLPVKTESGETKLVVPYTLRLLTIGDLAFQGISAEVVTTIGAAVREASPFAKTILVTHAMTYSGYVPDDWGYENNTFEASGTPVQKGYAQPAFIQGFDEMYSEMKKK